MNRPFGFRVFIQVDKNNMQNILGGKLLTGKIIDISDAISKLTENNLLKNDNNDAQLLLYNYANQILIPNKTEVLFTYSPDVINIINDNIYNVPVELIRQYRYIDDCENDE